MYLNDDLEFTEVVRRHNRVLRRLVGNLRRNVQRRGEVADNLFVALCETNPAAELAMRELWESGEFTCGPQDYDEIVKQSTEAMKFWRQFMSAERRKVQIEQTAQAQSQPS